MSYGLYPFLPLLRRDDGVHRQIGLDVLNGRLGVYGIRQMGLSGYRVNKGHGKGDVHLNCLNDDIFGRTVISPWSDLDCFYTIEGIFPADKFPKDRVFPI
jgi:hypothetical protein